jgi:L-alanine-DL-glutamate epimerase-like enolase superfamily enzyme
MIQTDFHVDFLTFRYPFRIAHGERIGTDVVFVVLRMDGFDGFGEATLPPYLGVTTSDVMNALSRPGISEALAHDEPLDWFQALHEIIPDIMPALAALDMARWQVYLKQSNQTIAVAIGIENVVKEVPHTFTLGVSGESEMKEKISFAQNLDFNLFKLKLNGINDQEVLSTFRSLSSAPFAVDANQAWTSIDQCLACLDFLETEQCVLIEQPFNKLDRRLTHELKSRTDIPVIADEACQQLTDLEDVLQVFDGVNVKLQKCGGITPA